MPYLTRDQLDQHWHAISMWRDGHTVHEIAHELHETPFTVESWLTATGDLRRCHRCTIILDNDEYELCDTCRHVLAGEPHPYSRVPLSAPEQDPFDLREAFRYARAL